MWLNSDILEKRYATNIYCKNHDMTCALDKTIMDEVSRNIINFIIAFHDVNLDLYAVTNIYPRPERSITVFRSDNLGLLTVTSIDSIRKSAKEKLQNRLKSERQKIQGCTRLKQVKRQRNRVKK